MQRLARIREAYYENVNAKCMMLSMLLYVRLQYSKTGFIIVYRTRVQLHKRGIPKNPFITVATTIKSL